MNWKVQRIAKPDFFIRICDPKTGSYFFMIEYHLLCTYMKKYSLNRFWIKETYLIEPRPDLK